MDPRTYLIQRFGADRDALVQRAEQLRAVTTKNAPRPAGPDANTSQQMADACEAVVRLLVDSGSNTNAVAQISELLALVPHFEQLGGQQHLSAPVRSVYVGAATRIREIGVAESAATAAGSADHGEDDADDADDADDNVDMNDDDDVDDDDLDTTNGVGDNA